ncbi:hypothetical protein JXJ21_00715 [candidate division KSB1 bacterium]|nr:hypothetical protein [candidate division KSB1 bacterium]
MKLYVVVSAVGRDRPGLVNKISHEIKKNGGNIELQRSAKMVDEFALISLVSLDAAPEQAEHFIASLRDLQSDDFFIYARKAVAASSERPAGALCGELIAEGADQMGLIDEITLLLFENAINIEAMEYDVQNAPMTGTQLFQMHAKIVLPAKVDVAEFKKKLRGMEDRLNIDILFRFPVE